MSLGSVETSEYIMKVLEFANSSQVRNQDFVFVITSVGSSSLGRKLTWDFFRKNFDKVIRKTNPGFLTTRLIKGSTGGFSTFAMAKEVEEFFAQVRLPFESSQCTALISHLFCFI